MSYRPARDFDRPTAESFQRSRRSMLWIIPFILIQQGTAIFRQGADPASRFIGAVAWIVVSLTILRMIFGLPSRWLSERDQAILNDEWNQSISGDAARWGIAALILISSGMMRIRIWMSLDSGLAIYGIANGALIVAIGRYAWLNRSEPEEDE